MNIFMHKDQAVMMASPEKALFDKVITTKGVLFRSTIQVYQYLIENLRIDEERLKALNVAEMSLWLDDAPKKTSLKMMLKTLENL
jgi:hypothetical protein